MSGVGAVPTIKESEVIADVIVVEPDVHGDERGRFVETYRRSWFPLGPGDGPGQPVREAGRGHRRPPLPPPPGRLLVRAAGHRPRRAARPAPGSPTDGATLALDLDGDHDRGLFIPPGVAHGFASLTDLTLWYLVDSYYNPDDELGVAWDDPAIGADWGVTDPGAVRPGPGQPAAVGDPRRACSRGSPADLSSAAPVRRSGRCTCRGQQSPRERAQRGPA